MPCGRPRCPRTSGRCAPAPCVTPLRGRYKYRRIEHRGGEPNTRGGGRRLAGRGFARAGGIYRDSIGDSGILKSKFSARPPVVAKVGIRGILIRRRECTTVTAPLPAYGPALEVSPRCVETQQSPPCLTLLAAPRRSVCLRTPWPSTSVTAERAATAGERFALPRARVRAALAAFLRVPPRCVLQSSRSMEVVSLTPLQDCCAAAVQVGGGCPATLPHTGGANARRCSAACALRLALLVSRQSDVYGIETGQVPLPNYGGPAGASAGGAREAVRVAPQAAARELSCLTRCPACAQERQGARAHAGPGEAQGGALDGG